MNIIEMIEDYARRAPTRLTPQQIAQVAMSNHVITGDDCFIVYSTILDEIYIMLPYAAKGKSIEPLGRQLEQEAKQRGFKRIKLVTDRENAFLRKFKDYHPIGTVMEKRLD
jgi:hypothetical protein